jgi:hypothetical protein
MPGRANLAGSAARETHHKRSFAAAPLTNRSGYAVAMSVVDRDGAGVVAKERGGSKPSLSLGPAGNRQRMNFKALETRVADRDGNSDRAFSGLLPSGCRPLPGFRPIAKPAGNASSWHCPDTLRAGYKQTIGDQLIDSRPDSVPTNAFERRDVLAPQLVIARSRHLFARCR